MLGILISDHTRHTRLADLAAHAGIEASNTGSMLPDSLLLSHFVRLGPPVVLFYQFLFGWEGSPTKIDYRKRVPLL